MTPPDTKWKVLNSDGVLRVFTSKKLEVLLARRSPFVPSIRYVWFKHKWNDLKTPDAVMPSNDPDTLKFHLKKKKLTHECDAVAASHTQPLAPLLVKHKTAIAQQSTHIP